MNTPGRRAWRITRLAAIGAVAVTLLSACITVKADLTVNPDASASGTFSLELQKEAAGFLGITSVDDFAKGIDSGEVTGDTGFEQFQDCSPSETDAGYVYSCTFTNATFTDTNGPWTITKDGDQITFHIASTGSGAEGDTSAQDVLGDASIGDIEVSIEFPGSISSITGSGAEQTSDTSATISGSLTDQMDVTIVSAAGGGFSLSSILVIVIFAAILILIIVVVVVLIMRRRSSTPELDAATVAAAESISPPADAQPLTALELAELEAPVEGADSGSDAADTPADSSDAPVVEEVADEVVETGEGTVVEETTVADEAVSDAPPDGGSPLGETGDGHPNDDQNPAGT